MVAHTLLIYSGLNSDNDIGDFTKFYQYKISYHGENMSAMQIGNGEYIFFQQVGRWTVGKPVFVELTFIQINEYDE